MSLALVELTDPVSAAAPFGVSVLDFGADPTGTRNSTASFDAAIATGSKVWVPKGQYRVSNIRVVPGLDIEGEGTGLSGKTRLLVDAPGQAAFRISPNSNSSIEDIRIANFEIGVSAGVREARGFMQTDKSGYTAYCRFEGIETRRELKIGYDGFFIFTVWSNCRDGYRGMALDRGEHWAIDSIPASTSQNLQTNLNKVLDCQFFNASAKAPACVNIKYGASWRFESVDFEQLATRAVASAGVFQGTFEHCWFEAISGASAITLEDTGGPNAQGSQSWSMDGCFGALHEMFTGTVWAVSGNCGISVTNSAFSAIGKGVRLINDFSRIRAPLSNVTAISGPGAASFFGEPKRQ